MPQALQPKLESMEASWYRLHTITGADTPEEVIDYWLGLKSKEENMRELVRLAEVITLLSPSCTCWAGPGFIVYTSVRIVALQAMRS